MLRLRDGQGVQISKALGEGALQEQVGPNGHPSGVWHRVRLGLVGIARELQQGAVDLWPGFQTARPLGTWVEMQLEHDARPDEDRVAA